jgi:hypothetical protein
LTGEFFSSGFELQEKGKSFISSFHEEERNKTGVAINEEDVMRKIAIRVWKWATNVAMNMFKKMRSTLRSFIREG